MAKTTTKRPAAKPKKKSAVAATSEKASSAFARNLIARGQAAPAKAKGVAGGGEAGLPPGATHEITGKTKSGEPIVVRRRFSLT